RLTVRPLHRLKPGLQARSVPGFSLFLVPWAIMRIAGVSKLAPSHGIKSRYPGCLNELIQKLPIATTVVAFAFAAALFNHWQKRKEATHLAWWTLGIILYGAGTLSESAHAFLGWNEWIFRAWYIAGALLGAAPLAQGTVYLLLRKKTANQLSLVLLIAIMAGSICVLASPIDYTKVDANRLTGSVFLWQWVRWF